MRRLILQVLSDCCVVYRVGAETWSVDLSVPLCLCAQHVWLPFWRHRLAVAAAADRLGALHSLDLISAGHGSKHVGVVNWQLCVDYNTAGWVAGVLPYNVLDRQPCWLCTRASQWSVPVMT